MAYYDGGALMLELENYEGQASKQQREEGDGDGFFLLNLDHYIIGRVLGRKIVGLVPEEQITYSAGCKAFVC